MQVKDLNGIIQAINKSITASFFAVLLLSVVVLNGVYFLYQHNRKQMMLQKIDATFLLFSAKFSEKLSIIANSNIFVDFLRSGRISRELLLPEFLFEIHNIKSKVIVGMKMFDNNSEQIFFSRGKKSKNIVSLDLCYLNKRLDPYAGNCTYRWDLYFDKKEILNELKKITPGLMICDSCVSRSMLKNPFFGNFPVSRISKLDFKLAMKDNSKIIFLFINLFITAVLLILTIRNIKKTKEIFKVNLLIPLSEITTKIRNKITLPKKNAIKELSYLVQQIDQWKKQVVELEEFKVKEKSKEEKIKIMQSIGASIAHELRTPLRSIISVVSGIEKLFPALLENYDLARKANLPAKIISPQKIEQLHKVLAGLKKEGLSANTIVDMFLMKMRGTIAETSSIKQLSIVNCINESLERYSFQVRERKLVIYDANNDFQFKGDKLLVVHILFNLLKNALYYIASVHKGKIYIHLERRKDENVLCFRDTSKGIAKEVLPRIFDRFYSKTEGGAGIGLSFCKMAMEWMCGYITCQSVEGEYTEFILHFSKLEE